MITEIFWYTCASVKKGSKYASRQITYLNELQFNPFDSSLCTDNPPRRSRICFHGRLAWLGRHTVPAAVGLVGQDLRSARRLPTSLVAFRYAPRCRTTSEKMGNLAWSPPVITPCNCSSILLFHMATWGWGRDGMVFAAGRDGDGDRSPWSSPPEMETGSGGMREGAEQSGPGMGRKGRDGGGTYPRRRRAPWLVAAALVGPRRPGS